MRSKTLLLSFCFFAITSQAQDSSFQLKDYKYRTPGFKALSIGIDFSGSVSDSKSEDLTKNSTRSFYLLPSNLRYSRFISTEKRAHTSDIYLAPYGRTFYSERNGKAAKSKEFSYNFYWDRHDRFYKANKWFFELGNKLSHSFETGNHKDTIYNTKGDNVRVEDRLSLGFGKGRIERVQDAQMALYILNDLQEEGLLNGPVSAQTAQGLAKLITEISNQRIFDNRRRRIYELTRIDSFLRSSGLIDVTDMRHFAIVNDNWALANNPGRSSGSAWFVQLQPSAGIQKAKNNYVSATHKTTGTNTNKFLKLSPVIGFEKYIPVNLKWQRNMGLTVSWLTGWTDYHYKSNVNGTELQTSQSFHESKTSFSGFYGLDYYPNNRTALNANIGMEASHIKYDEDNPSLKNSTLLRPFLNFSTDYFINYKTRFSAHWNVIYEKSFIDPVLGSQLTAHNFTTSFGAGLFYYIF